MRAATFWWASRALRARACLAGSGVACELDSRPACGQGTHTPALGGEGGSLPIKPHPKRAHPAPPALIPQIYITGHGGNEFIKFQDQQELMAGDVADALAQVCRKLPASCPD